MKKIEAVVGSAELEPVNAALLDSGFEGVTVAEVGGRESQSGVERCYRGQAMAVELEHKVKIEIIVRDDDADRVVSLVSNAVRKSHGSIFVYDVSEILRICNQQRDEAAI